MVVLKFFFKLLYHKYQYKYVHEIFYTGLTMVIYFPLLYNCSNAGANCSDMLTLTYLA